GEQVAARTRKGRSRSCGLRSRREVSGVVVCRHLEPDVRLCAVGLDHVPAEGRRTLLDRNVADLESEIAAEIVLPVVVLTVGAGETPVHVHDPGLDTNRRLAEVLHLEVDGVWGPGLIHGTAVEALLRRVLEG